ncbi:MULTISPECIES: dTMP kinase [unclassified Oleiphilus]|uniref:dTMP kinase n=1 Tax=unclassified Oleiphilus TaxID=2631174 RepID=UPI0007C2E138|nr:MULTISPECIES: dTMP kinase [unclassified Oleiphilus]KZY45455.1 dTMP kinase [Oleiphilus sp. HI0050]KZY81486.1 dTMP kinase [Oleiphilus sp. HI0068]KZY85646.1 dTMP kinase [Oleiphilus sp. HI0069]KZY86226.1 dTMP kinase [Oleiphilus sp. HI0072]KZZ06986.1 dTMP kinase [Oleiphilus sp. HI0078]KZZ28947.1 dTMP kinase [Oleiphilus sp. HI0081]
MDKGLFITIEGGEGVGKSTNIAFIQEALASKGIESIITREPGGTHLAEEIREVLIKNREETVASETELLLMFAARAQHLHQKILPALEKGVWVISDRFTDATYAYQSGGRGVPSEKVALLENFVQGDVRPDLTLLLDAPIEVGMARAKNRGALDRFEEEQAEFFNNVRDNYLARAEAEPKRFKIVDATQSLEEVQSSISVVLENIL